MHSCKRLQSASSHMRKIVLLKTASIVKWFNWNDHKYQCIVNVVLRHNYEKLSEISNDNKSDLHNKWHYESINTMWNQRRNEKLLKSSVNTDNYRFQSLQRVSAKIALQLKNNEWEEVHQYSERTNVEIIVESWNETSMHKWVHQAIAECIEEDHQDFYSLNEIIWNDQSRMNEEVYKDHQEHAMNEKKLSNHQWLNRVHSSMWQEEQDHQKTKTQ